MKYVVSDLDGTMLNKNKEILPIVKESILKMKECNTMFIVATGRNYSAAMKLFSPEIKPDYLVSCNGAYVYDCRKNKVLYSTSISHDDALSMLRYMSQIMDWGYVLSKDYYYKTQDSEAMSKLILQQDIIYKVEILLKKDIDGKAVLPKLREIFCDFTVTLVLDSVSGKQIVEIVPFGIDKASGLEIILKRENVNPESLIAFGDGYNDIPVFQSVGTKFAVSNAVDELKMLATEVIGSSENGGVGFKILKLFEDNY